MSTHFARGSVTLLLLLFVMIPHSAFSELSPAVSHTVISPGGDCLIRFELRDGAPYWQAGYGATPVIQLSRLGLRFQDAAHPPLDENLEVVATERINRDERWTQPWGETKQVHDHFNGLRVTLGSVDHPAWRLILELRAYDDGVAFRYELPDDIPADSLHIMDERTQFRLADDWTSWSIDAYQGNRYEYLYQQRPASALDTVHTPVTFETFGGLAVSIHEAALTDYASMTLARTGGLTFEADLVPWSDGVKVRTAPGMKSPWRTIQMAATPADLLESTLILNLNEPNRIDDTSWIKPGKYVGIWWEMHLDLATWGSGKKHGATTANTRKYIDFAAEHGFDGVLVEGWNVGWDGNWMENADDFSFTEPYPDYELRELADYARGKGVRLIGHNETSTGILNYEQQLEDAFSLYEELGIRAVKTGYVGHGQQIKRRDPETGDVLGLEWHHGQWMVRHYRHVVETAAKHHIMLDVHEPIKPTGIRRTWPNMMTREGARGQEYNAWASDGGNPPDHTTILPFTRMLAGPFDHTPGIFDLTLDRDNRPSNRVQTTLAKQLALYVVLYSPLHMAADLPENYQQPDGSIHPMFQFIKDVPTDWQYTRALNGRIGDYVTLARKDRNSADWYLGAVTDEHPRDFIIPLDFLHPGQHYTATVYCDAGDSHYLENPEAYQIDEIEVTSESVLPVHLAPGGGVAVRFTPAT